MEHMTPRGAHVVALKTERERAGSMVFSALYKVPAMQRRDRNV